MYNLMMTRWLFCKSWHQSMDTQVQFEIKQGAHNYQLTTSWLQTYCHLTAKLLSPECRLTATWLLPDSHLTANWLPSIYWLTATWLPADRHLTATYFCLTSDWLPHDCCHLHSWSKIFKKMQQHELLKILLIPTHRNVTVACMTVELSRIWKK